MKKKKGKNKTGLQNCRFNTPLNHLCKANNEILKCRNWPVSESNKIIICPSTCSSCAGPKNASSHNLSLTHYPGTNLPNGQLEYLHGWWPCNLCENIRELCAQTYKWYKLVVIHKRSMGYSQTASSNHGSETNPERHVRSTSFTIDAYKADNLINPAQIHN